MSLNKPIFVAVLLGGCGFACAAELPSVPRYSVAEVAFVGPDSRAVLFCFQKVN